MENYLASRHQKTKVKDVYSLRSIVGVPQGLILGPFLFKTF